MPINSWTVNIISAIVLTVMMGGGFFLWKTSIEDAALAKVKLEQVEKQLNDQIEAMKDTEANLKESADLIADLKDKMIELNNKTKSLEVYLDNQPKDQKESSEVLKRTFKELSQ